jgi:hypothetical protein
LPCKHTVQTKTPHHYTTNNTNTNNNKTTTTTTTSPTMNPMNAMRLSSWRTNQTKDQKVVRDNSVASTIASDPSQKGYPSDPIEGGILKITTEKEALIKNYSRASSEKGVSFSTIDVHTHLIKLGDNPSTTAGPPLTISWKAFDSQTVSLEEFEESRKERRDRDDLIIPRYVREDWLRAIGYSWSDLKKVILILNRAREKQDKIDRRHARVNALVNALKRALRISSQ